jgi:hypothetical protein
MVSRRPEELYPRGDRASVAVKKRGNARGAKGGMKSGLAPLGTGPKSRLRSEKPASVHLKILF